MVFSTFQKSTTEFSAALQQRHKGLHWGVVATSRLPLQEKRQFNNLRIVNCIWGGGGESLGLHPKILYFLISRHFYCFNFNMCM